MTVHVILNPCYKEVQAFSTVPKKKKSFFSTKTYVVGRDVTIHLTIDTSQKLPRQCFCIDRKVTMSIVSTIVFSLSQ